MAPKPRKAIKERQEGRDTNGHQRGPKARKNDQLPTATEKLLRPAQRGPHDRLSLLLPIALSEWMGEA